MDTMETKTTEIEFILYSTKFDDIIHIAPKELNTIPIESKLSKDIDKCYVMLAVLCFNYLGDKCLSCAIWMSTALTELLIFRFSCLLTNKGIA